MATWEEARLCPKCKQPGREDVSNPHPDGGRVVAMICENERCTWYRTGWAVQVAKDGSIPDRKKGPKEYPGMTSGQESMARMYMEQVLGEQELGPTQ